MQTTRSDTAISVRTRDARTAAMMARSHALRDECRRLRLQAAQRHRESLERMNACQRAGHACRSLVEEIKAAGRPQRTGERSSQDLATLIVRALSGVGIRAFVFESSNDTAHRS
jgi:hypothetical protein